MRKTFVATLALVTATVALAACGGASDNAPTELDVSPTSLLDPEGIQPAPMNDKPLPVEPDGGIGTTPDDEPIPVEPDGGIGDTPLPVEPDRGIGTSP